MVLPRRDEHSPGLFLSLQCVSSGSRDQGQGVGAGGPSPRGWREAGLGKEEREERDEKLWCELIAGGVYAASSLGLTPDPFHVNPGRGRGRACPGGASRDCGLVQPRDSQR